MVIRFHLDEHVHTAIAAGLRRRGIDTITTVEAGLMGADDRDHLAFGLSERRVLVTNDHDFLRLHAQGIAHAGIAYCQQGSKSIGEILRSLILLYECFAAEDMYERVEYL